jgi:hypothetical protein
MNVSAIRVEFDDESFLVALSDGRKLRVHFPGFRFLAQRLRRNGGRCGFPARATSCTGTNSKKTSA